MWIRALSATAVLALLAASPALAQVERTLSLGGDELRVVNLIGEVQVTGHDGDGFEVEVRVQGRDAEPGSVDIDVDEARSTIVLRFPEGVTRYRYPHLGRARSEFSFRSREAEEDEAFWRKVIGRMKGDRIRVTESGSGTEVWADVVIRVPRDGKVKAILGAGKATARDITGDVVLDTYVASITASEIRGNVVADAGSGPVTLERIRGKVVGDTGSGPITARGIEGRMNLDTGSGPITVEDSRGESLLADTGSGSIRLTKVACDAITLDTGSGSMSGTGISAGKLVADTGSGSVKMELVELGEGPVKIDTGSGGIQLRLPETASARIHASTGSGGIGVDMPAGTEILGKSRDEITLRIGDGKARIELGTGSGSIRIVA